MEKLEEPDKGQAWVVAIAACIINMILSGLSRMIGLLYVEVIETYGVSRQEATLPFTVRNSIRCLAGPLVGVVGQRYGIRAVTFCGGVLASLGAALCYLAPNVTWMAVFWGGFHGLGFAFANTLFQVAVNQYFEKYRATASGIALSGACFGSFVFPFVIEAILDNFGLSGGFLIMAGIVMHVLPPSLLLKSPPWVENPERYARLKALKMMQESVETLGTDMLDDTPDEEGHLEDFRKFARTTSIDNCPVEAMEVCSATRSLKDSSENLMALFENMSHLKEKTKCKRNVVCTLYKIYESPPLNRRHSSKDVSNYSINKTLASPIPTISEQVDAKKHSLKDLAAEAKEVTTKENQAFVWESIKAIGSLYKNPAYTLINVCMTTYVIIFIPILTVIVDYSEDKGFPKSAGKYLINAMAMGDLIGRLGFGWVTDKGIISIPVFITLAFIFQGIFILLFPLATTLYSFMILLLLYGVTAGTVLVHFPLLVLKYVDASLQSIAMGCVGFMSGIVSFAIPLLIGHFRDNVGSYDGMFYLTGSISIVSGGFWLLEPLMLRIHHRNVDKRELAKEKVLNEGQFEGCKPLENVSSSNGHKTAS